MRNARFLTGMMMLMCPALGVGIASREVEEGGGPSVKGRVMYRGRPLSKGMIFFVAKDRGRSGDMVAVIDRQGYYASRPPWWKERAERAEYSIHVFPDPRRCDDPAGDPCASSREGVIPASHVDEGCDTEPSRMAAVASTGSPGQSSWESPRSEVPLPDFSASNTPRIEVALDAEPVRVDVNLKD